MSVLEGIMNREHGSTWNKFGSIFHHSASRWPPSQVPDSNPLRRMEDKRSFTALAWKGSKQRTVMIFFSKLSTKGSILGARICEQKEKWGVNKTTIASLCLCDFLSHLAFEQIKQATKPGALACFVCSLEAQLKLSSCISKGNPSFYDALLFSIPP